MPMPEFSLPERLCWPHLPLAVYREIAAHLGQVAGVEVVLLPQTALDFDYALSQVGGLELRSETPLSAGAQDRVLQILDYYSSCFGKWQSMSDGR